MLPLARERNLDSVAFWLGFAFVLFPLNLLIYGWNDLVDRETDAVNPRKDSFLFGARGTAAQLALIPPAIVVTILPFVTAFTLLEGWRIAAVLGAIAAVVWIYNLPQHGLRQHPPLELLNQLGYLLILPFATVLNHVPALPWQSIAYLALFCTHAHLMGEIMDVVPDRIAGRRTTATEIGVIPTKCIVFVLLAVEAIGIISIFQDIVLGGFLALGACWLIFDIAYFRDGSYSRNQFLLFGAGLNATGFASMAWVWFTGTLTRLP